MAVGSRAIRIWLQCPHVLCSDQSSWHHTFHRVTLIICQWYLNKGWDGLRCSCIRWNPPASRISVGHHTAVWPHPGSSSLIEHQQGRVGCYQLWSFFFPPSGYLWPFIRSISPSLLLVKLGSKQMTREQCCKGQVEMLSAPIFSLRQSLDFLSVGNMLCLHTETGVRDSKFGDLRKQVLGHVMDRDLRLTRALGSRRGVVTPPLPH